MDSNNSSFANIYPREDPALLAVTAIFSVAWAIFCLILWPRILGALLTTLLRLFYKKAYIAVGAIRVCPLSGSLFFKDVVYVDEDNSFRAVDGFIAVPWWIRPKAYPDPSKSTVESPGTIKSNLFTIKLNGFHFHWYNRAEAYRVLEQKFNGTYKPKEEPDTDSRSSFMWHKYISVVQVLLTKGSLTFGNSSTPHSLVVHFSEASATHTVSPPYNPLDERLNTTVLEAIDVKAYMQKSAGYNKPVEEPPVSDANGFLFAETTKATFTYSVDEPGVHQSEEVQGPGPRFLFRINAGPGTKINYGPWVHRQRLHLQRMLVPHDYTEEPVSLLPAAGKRRVFTNLDVILAAPDGAELNIMFREATSVSILTLKTEKDCHIVINQPWVSHEDGYTSVIKGVFNSPQFKTSLPYPHAASAHSLQFNVRLHFPRRWNALQKWDMQFTAEDLLCRVMIHYVDFLDALLKDWWGDEQDDFMFFVPLKWTVGFTAKNYEIFVPTNRYNWMDISMHQTENSALAFCGEAGLISFEFPLMDFKSLEQNVFFQVQADNLVLRKYLPPSCSTKQSVFSLSSANRRRWRRLDAQRNTDSSAASSNSGDNERFPLGCCISTRYEDGWLDLAAGRRAEVKAHYISKRNDGLDKKIPQGLTPPPNTVTVAVLIDKPIVRAFGSLGKEILAIKENFVGDYPYLNTFNSEHIDGVVARSDIPEIVVPDAPVPVAEDPSSNMYRERFLNIHVDFKLTNATAEFPLHPTALNPEEVPLPSMHLSSLNLLVDYHLDGTHITLKLDQLCVLVPGKGSVGGAGLGRVGSVCCPGIEIQAQGYTEPLHHQRVEYAWMIAVHVEDISGSLGIHQVPLVVEWFESAVLHAASPGDRTMEAPGGCVIAPTVEPEAEEVKYKLLNIYLNSVTLDIFSEKSNLLVQTPGFVLHICNLQREGYGLSVSFSLPEVQLQALSSLEEEDQSTFEVLNATLKGLSIEARIREEPMVQRQMNFIRAGDRRTQRLSFLWPDLMPGSTNATSCGCGQGCQFTNTFRREATLTELSPTKSVDVANEEDFSSPGTTALCLENVDDVAKLHFWLFSHRSKPSTKEPSTLQSLYHALDDSPDDLKSSPSVESFFSATSHISNFPGDSVPCAESSRDRDHKNEEHFFMSSLSSSQYSTVVTASSPSGTMMAGTVSSVVYQTEQRGICPEVKVASSRHGTSSHSTFAEDKSEVMICIKLLDRLSVVVTPKAAAVIDSLVSGLTTALCAKSPPAYLHLDMLSTVLGLGSTLERASLGGGQPEIESDLSQPDPSPLLCLSVSTSPAAVCDLQMVTHDSVVTGLNSVTLCAAGVNVGVLVTPAGKKSSALPADQPVTEESSHIVAASVTVSSIQMEFSITQPVSQSDLPNLTSTAFLAFSLLPPEGYFCMPVFQLSVDNIAAKVVTSLKTSQTGVPTLTFSEILGDDARDRVFHKSSNSNLSVFLTLGTIRSSLVYSLSVCRSCNVIGEIESLVKQFQGVLEVVNHVQEAIASVSVSRTRNLCRLLYCATSHSGSILPNAICTHLDTTKAIRETAIYQCLQQLSAAASEASLNACHLSPEELVDGDILQSLVAGLAAKLTLGSKNKPPQRHFQKEVPARRLSIFSIQSQASLHLPAAIERPSTSNIPRSQTRPDMLSHSYKKCFQKLGHEKLTLLLESLSSWLPRYFRTQNSSESFTSFNIDLILPSLSLELNMLDAAHSVPVVDISRVQLCGCGKVMYSLPFAKSIGQKVSAQVSLGVDHIAVSATEVFHSFAVITALQFLKTPNHEKKPASTPSRNTVHEEDGDTAVLPTVDAQLCKDFVSNICRYYKDALGRGVRAVDSARPHSPDVLITSQSHSEVIFRIPQNSSQEDLVPLVDEEEAPATPSGGVVNPAFVMSPGLPPLPSVSQPEEEKEGSSGSADFDVALYATFGSIRVVAELESLKARLQLGGLSFCSLSQVLFNSAAGVDFIKNLSVSSSFCMKKAQFEIYDEGWNPSVLVRLSIPDALFLASIVYQENRVKLYQVLIQFPSVDFDLKQPPVIIQKVVHLHLPTFRALYKNIQPFLNEAPKLPANLPGRKEKLDFSRLNELMKILGKGSCLIVVQKVSLLVTALPSLTLMYYGSHFVGQFSSNQEVKISFSCSSHNLKFTPRVHLEDISVRDVYLPSFEVGATLSPREQGAFPGASLSLHLDKIEIHLSTDILNQLLVVQSSFVKELDETLAILGEIQSAVPVPYDSTSSTPTVEKQPASVETSDVVMAALQTLSFSAQGVDITISTPSQTALRLTAGKIEVLISNVQSASREYLLCLLGKVEVDVHAALGFFQNSPDDLDAFTELAEFSTRLSIRDNSQISDSGSDDQGLTPLDTYSLTIHSPHLFIQSAAVEKGLAFWLYCKIAYSYWQDQRKSLQDEVQRATESLLQRIHRKGEASVPKLDFARPKLVQIAISDLGFCFPLTANPVISDMRPRAMPAIVITIHEMKITINVLKKIAIAGSFVGFCARFSEWFTARQKHWSIDLRKREIDNCATVPKGTCKICIGIKSTPGTHRVRLIWSLQWDMSGIDIHAKHDIGVHISSLVRTIFSVTGDIDRAEPVPTHGVSGPTVTISKPHSFVDRSLGPQPHQVQTLRQQFLKSNRKGGQRMSVLMDWSRPTLLKVMRERPGHRRTKSDVLRTGMESARSFSYGEEAEISQGEEEPAPSPNTDYTIDLDINVTVCVARGSITLHSSLPSSSDSSSPAVPRRGVSDSAAMFWSPGPNSRVPRGKDSARPPVPGSTSHVLIPAVSIKGNYSSDVVKGFRDGETISLDSFTESQMREGKLMLSVSVESLEKPITLNPSLSIFLEQVVQPISKTLDLSSQQNITTDPVSSEDISDTSGITIAETSAFPIHIFVHFHLKPSTIILTCEPVSRVHCEICIPDVCVACSFSLFSVKELDASLTSFSEQQTSTINDLSVTSCLSAFSISVISPQASSAVFEKFNKTGVSKGPRCVFSLQLGLASIHLSRKTFMAETNGVVHDKQCISITADVASVLLTFDIRQLNNATAFRKCWYRKSITESIVFGQGASTASPESKRVDSEDSSNLLSASITATCNITDLTFSANLAQVMGDAGIVLTNFGLRSHADILENELVQLTAKAFIAQVNADARGGVIAGLVNLNAAQIGLNTCSYEGKKPIHNAFVQVAAVDCRVDYMGAIQLMAKVTSLRFDIHEEWKGSILDIDSKDYPRVKVIVEFAWDTIKIIISQSTTRSMVNIATRLTDFVTQQKIRSEKTLLTMLPSAASRQNPLQTLFRIKSEQADGPVETSENLSTAAAGFLKYHHWLWATYERSRSLLLALGIFSDQATQNMSLGGEVHVSGEAITLACLHGSSFIEKEWAVFSLCKLHASFETQAIPCLAEDNERKNSIGSKEQIRVCQQTLGLTLGNHDPKCSVKTCAAIYKVTSGRGGIPLLSSNTNMDEWLFYRCEVIEPSISQKTGMKPSRIPSVETILSVPPFTFKLDNEHFWPSSDSLLEPVHPVPLVKCHLVTSFREGISVTTSVHRYDFLHNLITSYIEYLEDRESESPSKPKPPLDKGGLDLNCGRNFVCETWKLDPQLELNAGENWPAGKLNPHINLLLDWLGFKEAKVTIPKWVQRGAMDPMDLLFSKLLQLILLVSARKKTSE